VGIDYLGELTSTIVRFCDLAASATGAEPVPACDGWAVRDLAEHLGTIHRWAGSIVLSGQRVKEPVALVTDPLADWYAGTAEALLAALRAVSPDEPVPNFSRVDETASFWPRRQMHETVVHAVDLAQALGHDESSWAVAPHIAADGVEEVLRVFFPRLTAGGRRPHVHARIRLVATDVRQSWIVAPGDAGGAPVQLPPSHDADAVVTGTAADLYLALWNRTPHDRLSFDGPDGTVLFDGPTTP
jgi:uncharacterized protein (TIGR03083 family)